MENEPTIDGRGARVEPGNWVLWLATGSYSYPGVHQVLDVNDYRVKLDTGSWVRAYNVFVVDSVPFVEGTTNTVMKGTND